jgi:hypothetical protein
VPLLNPSADGGVIVYTYTHLNIVLNLCGDQHPYRPTPSIYLPSILFLCKTYLIENFPFISDWDTTHTHIHVWTNVDQRTKAMANIGKIKMKLMDEFFVSIALLFRFEHWLLFLPIDENIGHLPDKTYDTFLKISIIWDGTFIL